MTAVTADVPCTPCAANVFRVGLDAGAAAGVGSGDGEPRRFTTRSGPASATAFNQLGQAREHPAEVGPRSARPSDVEAREVERRRGRGRIPWSDFAAGSSSAPSGSRCRLKFTSGAQRGGRRGAQAVHERGMMVRSIGRRRAIARTRRGLGPAKLRRGREVQPGISSRASRGGRSPARSASPGSARPPGNATWPDHGSRGCSARRMKRSASSPSVPSPEDDGTTARAGLDRVGYPLRRPQGQPRGADLAEIHVFIVVPPTRCTRLERLESSNAASSPQVHESLGRGRLRVQRPRSARTDSTRSIPTRAKNAEAVSPASRSAACRASSRSTACGTRRAGIFAARRRSARRRRRAPPPSITKYCGSTVSPELAHAALEARARRCGAGRTRSGSR